MNRRGAVAVWVALILTPTLLIIALGLDEAQLSLTQIELQRAADISAYAGGLRAASSATGVPSSCASASNKLDCAYANAAADLAEVATAPSTSARSWSDTSLTLTDNLITAAVVKGIKNTSDVAVSVTLTKSLPALFAYPVNGKLTYTASNTAIAEVVAGTASGAQPCLVSLTNDITLSGNFNLTLNDCSMRSNNAIAMSGNGDVVASGIYADKTITTSGNVNINGTEYPNDGQISDPYASDSALYGSSGAFTKLATATGSAFSGGGSLSPGTYSSLTITSNLTLAAGLYLVTGGITVSGNSAINGTGVTIVSGGAIQMSGNINFNVTAPTSNVSGGIPGILIADNGTGGESVSGNYSASTSGVIYLPNSGYTESGNGGVNAQSSCMELIAAEVTISGNANLDGDCNNGALSFGSVPAVPTVSLVQ
ncbi:pilus assembly protein TadG-related protein [Acidisoma silvae]|uniref:Uncharacterized protein n=1 Tax=Acidisoma silvae TaxID=2802396 RepID=A0A963YS01_9PROT|nr:pilus assembly protein TadG-related protein [Acidisoma silvae]MCB8875906.1 hypothetical protein [Acidisoma silvae]